MPEAGVGGHFAFGPCPTKRGPPRRLHGYSLVAARPASRRDHGAVGGPFDRYRCNLCYDGGLKEITALQGAEEHVYSRHVGMSLRSIRVALTLGVILPLVGCVVVPASKVQTSREMSPLTLGEGRKIAILFSSDFSPQTSRALGEDMVKCIRAAVRDDMPGVTVVSQEEFFTAVFPGLTPEQVLIRADTIPALVARRELRQRIDQAGIDYLVLVGAQIDRRSYLEGGSGIVWGGWDKNARMNATFFDLRHGGAVGSGGAEASGSGFFVAPFLIPVGGGVDPDAPTCRALGAEVVRLLGGPTKGERR